MPISRYHFYHGAALSLIVSEGAFTGLARLPEIGSAAYAVNHNIGIYLKHSTKVATPWHFTFQPEHQETVRTLFGRYRDRTFVVLVCRDVGICLLDYGDYAAVIDENFIEQEAVTVERPRGGGFRVRGARGELQRVVPMNSFPSEIFEER